MNDITQLMDSMFFSPASNTKVAECLIYCRVYSRASFIPSALDVCCISNFGLRSRVLNSASGLKLLRLFLMCRTQHLHSTGTQGSDDGVLCVTGGGDCSLTWADLQSLAAAASQQQQKQPQPFTSLIVDTSIYSGDLTPDTWEWGGLAAVNNCCIDAAEALCVTSL